MLARFDPATAGLTEISEEDARNHIEQHLDERPWLASAKDCDPAVQRIFAALDRGQGHPLERHEGYADDDKLVRRVTALEDPAQLDPEKRAAGIDGCRPGNRDHECGVAATAIQDPYAFATVFVRGVEHPKVKAALQLPYESNVRPHKVSLPVEELLGADGHRYCSGYRLESVGGSSMAAQDCRTAWVDARRHGREPDVLDPKCSRIEDSTGAAVEYRFRPTASRDGYQVSTMYIWPPRRHSEGG